MKGCRIVFAIFIVGISLLSARVEASAESISHLCFFGPESDAIDTRCEQVLRDVLARSERRRDGQAPAMVPSDGTMAPAEAGPVEVIGHVDGAEAQRGHSIVGERRARAVAEWLIAAGIPRELVRLRPVNVRDMLVPTPPGIAEPRNRRTEVVRR